MNKLLKKILFILFLFYAPSLYANQDSLKYESILKQIKDYGIPNLDSALLYCDTLLQITQLNHWKKKELSVFLMKIEYATYGTDLKLIKSALDQANELFLNIKTQINDKERVHFSTKLNLEKAHYFQAIGFHKKSITIYLKLLTELEKKISKSKLDSTTLIKIYYNLGAIYKINGNFDSALNYYFKGIRLQNNTKSKLAYIGDIYSQKKEYNLAIDYYEQAIQIQKNRLQKLPKKNCRFIVSSLRGLSKIYLKTGNYDKAISLLKESSTYLKTKDSFYTSTYLNLGIAYKEKGNDQKAINYIQKAFQIIRRENNFGKKYSHAKYFQELGNVYLKIAQTKKALSYYQKSLICLIPNFNDKDYQVNPPINQVDIRKELIEVFSQKSLALQKLYLEENKSKKTADLCMATAELGIELIDRLRKEYGADTDKQFLLAQSYQLFEVAIEMAFESKQFEKAFQLSEQSKAMVLYQAIKNKQAERLASTDEASLEQLYQMRHDLQTCSAKIRDERDTKKLNELRDRKFELNRAYENLIHELEKNSDFKKTKEELPSLSIADIQNQVLQSGQAFVEYFVGKNYVYAFYLQPNATDLQCKKIPWTDALQKAAKEINNNIYQKKDTIYRKNARLLYKEFLASIFTEGMPERLLLIPDDVLGFVPFNALLTKDVPTKQWENFKDYPYLVKNTIITQGFSAAIQWEMQKQASASKGKVLAYAPGFLTPKTIQEAAAMRNQFMNLQFNTKEVGYVLECFRGKAICDEKATKKHFIQNASNAKVIHIASHAEVNRLFPNLSYIAFSNLEDSSDTAVIMYVEEVYNISLDAAMVVLSACETGVGDLIAGEGMISLARAFIYAGAKSIVTSLWKVSDRSSSQLMGYFYANLKNKQGKDVALNNSLKKYIDNAIDQDRGHPQYWAAFIIIGNTDVVIIPDFPWALVVIALLSFGGFLFWKWKKTKVRVTI